MDTMLLAELLEIQKKMRTDDTHQDADETTPATWSPPVDVTETRELVCILVDLPGVSREDLNVQYSGGEIIVSGVKREPATGSPVQYHCYERAFGAFRKRIPLPRTYLLTSIQASLREGILYLNLVKHALEYLPNKTISLSTPETGDPASAGKDIP